MPSKKEILLESIRKLLALNVPDREIALNLADVGISEEDAMRLVEEAKNPQAAARPKGSDMEKIFTSIEKGKAAAEKPASYPEEPELKEKPKEPPAERYGRMQVDEMAEDIMNEAGSEYRRGEEEQPAPEPVPSYAPPKEKPAEKKPFPAARKREQPSMVTERIIETVDLNKLWEKGILAAVNQRLLEMKRLKQQIDAILDEKVDAATKRELDKTRVLFDSQRALLISKVDTELESKADQLGAMIEMKLREMKDNSERIDSLLQELKAERQKIAQAGQQFSQAMAELQKTKSTLIAEMNSELIQIKSEAEQFLDSAKGNVQEMDDRVNKTLQLESEIVDGLAKDAESRILEKIESGEYGSKGIRKALQDLEASKAEFQRMMGEKLAQVDKIAATTGKESGANFKQQLADLEEFKREFIKVMQAHVQQFNKAIRQLNEAGGKEEDQINLRIQKIDKKIAELDAFEKNFSKEMSLMIEKLAEKKNG